MFCKNCGAELKEMEKGHFLHANKINIGSEEKPYFFIGGVLMSRETGCYYPEPLELLELVDNRTRTVRVRKL